MQNPVQITLRGLSPSDALERYVGEEARKLDQIHDRIVSCHVIAEALHPPKRANARFGVRLNLALQGAELAVNREHADDIFMALRSAFEAASRQLKDHTRRASRPERQL
jgi:ribosome-associated translation inhibitor RaiA